MTHRLSLIVAVADNNVIGIDNKMPWHIPDDFKHFKAKTIGKPCIMGRKTYESILDALGKPLPKRTSIVISRSNYKHEGCITASSLDEAIELAKAYASPDYDNEIIVMGGAQIYKLALPVANRIYLTRVHQEPEGDAFFPEFGPHWIEKDIDRQDGFSFVTLEKMGS